MFLPPSVPPYLPSLLRVFTYGHYPFVRHRILGAVVKNKSITLPGQGEHSERLPLKAVCPSLGGFVRSFIAMVQRGDVLTRVRVYKGLYSINLVSGNLLMHFSGSFNLTSVVFSGRKSADILHLLGILV